jgi:prepilin-type N-terminal cleavage/methylation domain-containing protein
MNHSSSRLNSKFGFTIVELLVVIVVIGILAAITLVSYTGITQKAIVTTLQSDLSNASSQLKIYQATYGSYPTTMVGNCPTAPTADNSYCLKASSGNTLTYSTNNGTTFALTDTNTNGVAYGMNDNSSPVALAQPTNCPTGFIPVPGSATYGQAGFCVMKYAASQVGSTTTPISQASGTPWVNISQTTAIANSQNVAGCTGCHLWTEAEYMTIAQNVLSVASNWSGGAVGTGYIYSGHNDNAPANALAPDSSDANGYSGETNTGGSQRRTLTLTNGQVVWDLAGNVWEWTAGQTNGTTAQQPGVSGSGWNWREWTSITVNGSLPINPSATATGLTGASTWNSTQGIGQIWSNSNDTGLYGFIRGGSWSAGGIAGVLALSLGNGPGNTYYNIGFRVSR